MLKNYTFNDPILTLAKTEQLRFHSTATALKIFPPIQADFKPNKKKLNDS